MMRSEEAHGADTICAKYALARASSHIRRGQRRAGANGRAILYPYALRTRKSAGLMTRKLSVTESQKMAQFFGTSLRRKFRTDRQKSL